LDGTNVVEANDTFAGGSGAECTGGGGGEVAPVVAGLASVVVAYEPQSGGIGPKAIPEISVEPFRAEDDTGKVLLKTYSDRHLEFSKHGYLEADSRAHCEQPGRRPCFEADRKSATLRAEFGRRLEARYGSQALGPSSFYLAVHDPKSHQPKRTET
jgi:hypothetical protein